MAAIALERTPLELLRGLTSGEVSASELSVAERRMCVEVLRDEGHTISQAATLLGVSRSTIARDERAVAERYAAKAKIFSPVLRAVRLERTADRVKSKATEAKDWALVWRVERELQHELALVLRESQNADDQERGARRLYLDELDPEAKKLLLEAVETELARRQAGD